MKRMVMVALFSMAVVASSRVRADIWVGGHGDIGVGLTADNQLELHFHFEEDADAFGGGTIQAGEWGASDIQVFVPLSPFTQPAGSQWEFLGAGADNPLWLLPNSSIQAADLGAPFLGFGSEELPTSGWTGGLTWSLTSFSGPGNFALWLPGFTPTVFMSTANGVGGEDFFDAPVGGHEHFNLTFSEQGLYNVGFTVTGIYNGVTLSDTANFTFIAGVPEPSSMVLLGCAGSGLFAGWVRRRRTRVGADAGCDLNGGSVDSIQA
jgi:hypothetical protein